MYYIVMLAILAISFFVINGMGKLALSLYAYRKLSRRTASVISLLSLAVWYVAMYVIVTQVAFHVALWLGWVVAVLLGIVTLVAGFGSLKKDNDHSLQLAHDRRKGKSD